MAKPFLSIIIPTHNDAGCLPLTLIDIDKHLETQDYTYEIIVADTASTDGTVEIVKRFQPLIHNLKLHITSLPHTPDAGLRSAMLSAKGKFRLSFGVDNAVSIVEWNKMIPYFKQGYDVLIGSRRFPRAFPAIVRLHGVNTLLYNFLLRIIFLWNVRDGSSPFQCYSEEAARHVFLQSLALRASVLVEALARARKLGYHCKEIPVHWIYGAALLRHTESYWSALGKALQLRWRFFYHG